MKKLIPFLFLFSCATPQTIHKNLYPQFFDVQKDEIEFWSAIIGRRDLVEKCIFSYPVKVQPSARSAMTTLSKIVVPSSERRWLGHEYGHAVLYCLGAIDPFYRDKCGNDVDIHHVIMFVFGHRSMNSPPTREACYWPDWTKDEFKKRLNTILY